MYVAVKGGERAIDAAHGFLAEERRGDPSVPELSVEQIREQMKLAVNRVMAEGSLHDPDLAALAIKQARGDLIEAVFLIRAYRTTLPRLGASTAIDTGSMACVRRISATFKDAPGGQVLGPTFDYTHRLLDFRLLADGEVPVAATAPAMAAKVPHITDFLNRDGLIEQDAASDAVPPDLTREPMELPASRALRLQALTRGDEGFVLSLAYSTQRGYGRTHAFVGELRIGVVPVGEYASLPTLAAQGPEPWNDALDDGGLWRNLKRSNVRIKTQLLSQRPLAGVGNIYADEALWRAGIHPARRSITRREAEALLVELRTVLEQGIANGGTTLRDYRTPDGEPGRHQHELGCYGRAGEPCGRCGTELKRSIVDARGTTHCPHCQTRR